MKKIQILLLLLILLSSCTITRKLKIEHKTLPELSQYYNTRDITDFFIVKDYSSFEELNKLDKSTIPQNIIFDEDGFEIEHFDDKLCANHTIEFLKKHNKGMALKKTSLHIDNYIKNLTPIDSRRNKNEILKTKKIRVFCNTATYADRYNVNQEAWDLYKNHRDKYDIYIVNLDLHWKKEE